MMAELLEEQQRGLRVEGEGERRADLQPVMHTSAGCLRLLIKLETAKKKKKKMSGLA